MQGVKIGSACLFDEGELAEDILRTKAREIELGDTPAFLVVSGSIPLGRRRRGADEGDDDRVKLQQYASIGQPELMRFYDSLFEGDTAQMLVTYQDLRHRNDIEMLMDACLNDGVTPVVNYNDGVNFDGVEADNDRLAAEVATYCAADRLIILGKDYDGMTDPDGNLVEHVSEITPEIEDYCYGPGDNGTGGFTTKIQAARIMMAEDREMIVSNIRYPLEDIVQGHVPRTLFKR